MIEVIHIKKQYGEKYAVEDLSFTVEDGKLYGLLGTNGAGKSTTMNIITGYLRADGGSVRINGYDISKEQEKAKRQIGYLPEIPPVYPDMTVTEYLTFAAELKKIGARQVRSEISRVMEITDIAPMQRRLVRNLSKGYKQRLGLAMALIGDPKILVLDEPTVGLDPLQIAEMRYFIKSLGGSHSVLLSSHILSEIEAVCEDAIILREGKVVAAGAIGEIGRQAGRGREHILTVKADPDTVQAVLTGAHPEWTVTALPGEDGTAVCTVTGEGPEDIREALFYLLAEHRMPILSLGTQHRTLETAFMELMKEEEKL